MGCVFDGKEEAGYAHSRRLCYVAGVLPVSPTRHQLLLLVSATNSTLGSGSERRTRMNSEYLNYGVS